MESEKVKEIKKALENCQKNNCLDCPYFIDEKRCRANDLLLDTITLINELEEEIEESAFYSKGYAQGIKNTYEVVIPDKLKQFAERLKEKSQKSFINVGGLTASAKTVTLHDIDETLKEFLK